MTTVYGVWDEIFYEGDLCLGLYSTHAAAEAHLAAAHGKRPSAALAVREHPVPSEFKGLAHGIVAEGY